jgi:transposase-like protein
LIEGHRVILRDTAVEAFRSRPLDADRTRSSRPMPGAHVREVGRVINMHVLIAAGVNAEDGPDWRSGGR